MAWTYDTWLSENKEELWGFWYNLTSHKQRFRVYCRDEYFSRDLIRVEDTHPLPDERRNNG